MSYDVKSAELAQLDEFAGAKVNAMTSLGYAKPIEFTNVDMAGGETGQLTGALPQDSRIIGIFATAISGTGTVDIKLVNATQTVTVISGAAPASAPVLEGAVVPTLGGEVYAEATGAVMISGYILIATNA